MTGEELHEILRVWWMENYWRTTRSFGGGLITAPTMSDDEG